MHRTDRSVPTRLHRRRRAGAALAGVLLAGGWLGACAGTPSSDELVDALQRAGLSATEATCAADALYRNLDDDQIGAIAERGPSAVIDDTTDPDEPIDVARREIAACRTADSTATTSTTEPVDGGGSTTSTPEGTSTSAADGSSTTGPAGETTVPGDGDGMTTLGPGTSLPKEPLGTPTTVRPAG